MVHIHGFIYFTKLLAAHNCIILLGFTTYRAKVAEMATTICLGGSCALLAYLAI